MRRTNPKDAADPGWEQITWDEALDTIAERLLAIKAAARARGGCVQLQLAVDVGDQRRGRLGDAVGAGVRQSRTSRTYMELCGWGRYLAPLYTFGAPVPGTYLPDLDNAGCILFWGYNPSVARLAHATSTAAAVARGAKLIVVDPRKVGLAAKADHWLRVRPGTDGALALSMTHVMIENGWYDADFVRDWTNADDEVDGKKVWELLAAQLRGLPAGGRRGDHRRTGRGHRRRDPDPLGVAAARVLHVERARAAQQYDADHARDQRALRADRVPRRTRWQRVVRGGAGQPDRRHRAGVARRPAHGRRGRAAARARPLRIRDRRGRLHRGPRRAGQGDGRLRRQPGDGARRQRPRAGRPAQPGLLRPCRPVHDAHRRARRHRAAGDDAVRVRGAEDRLRAQPGGAVARPAPPAARPTPWRGPLRPADHLRPRHPARVSASTSGAATSRRRTATSSSRAASPSRSSGRTPRVCGCR